MCHFPLLFIFSRAPLNVLVRIAGVRVPRFGITALQRQYPRSLLLRSKKKWKRKAMLGNSITSQRLLTRKPRSLPEHLRDTTIKYLRRICRDAEKATSDFVTSLCQFSRPREKTRFPVHRLLLYFILRKIYHNSVENIQIFLCRTKISGTLRAIFYCY